MCRCAVRERSKRGDDRLHAEETAVQAEVLLDHQLVHGVRAQRIGRVIFAHRLGPDAAVREPRTGEHEMNAGIPGADSLEEHEAAAAVHVEIRERVLHASHGA